MKQRVLTCLAPTAAPPHVMGNTMGTTPVTVSVTGAESDVGENRISKLS